MMTLYVINLLSNGKGDYEVHRYGCPLFPNNFYEIGLYDNCFKAIEIAKEKHPTATCCTTCSPCCNDNEEVKKSL